MDQKPSTVESGNGGPPAPGKILPAGSVTLPARPSPGKGAGRPTNASKGLALAPKHPDRKGGNPPAAKTNPDSDPAFVVETGLALLEIADEGLAAILNKKVRSFLPADKCETLIAMRRDASLGKHEKDLVEKSLTEIVRKYDWASKYGPEILLGLVLAQYGVRQARVFAMIGRLEKEILAARKGGKIEDKPAAVAVNAEKPFVGAVAKEGEKFPGPGDVVKPGVVAPAGGPPVI